ncbi:Ulp1 protease family, C-terminal catalytic domain [Sesbania bispinosa]|nr:Ulp1 protease family, C-terminal catalytic domain [Sesbania bispinosa]
MDGENTASRVRRIEGKVDSISERVDRVENTCAIILHTVRSLDILLRKDRENGGSNSKEVPAKLSTKPKSNKKQKVIRSKSGNKLKEKSLSVANEKATIIFDVSDDDDTYQNAATSFRIGKKSSLPFPNNEKPQFATTGHETKVKHDEDYFSWAYKPYMSEYRRGKGKEDDTTVTNNPNIRTKLFMTPAVETGQEKVFDEGKQPHLLPGLTLPKEIKTKFPTKKSMRLDEFKLRVCAFVFHPNKDPREVIFRMGDMVGTREDFECLCPNKKIENKIFTMLAMKATWTQHHITNKTVWSLPPSFVEDILLGHTIEDLLTTYADYWMKPFEALKYIYVPMKDATSNWYLMVISLNERALYHLSSIQDPTLLDERAHIMKNVCNVVAQMVSTECYASVSLKGKMDVGMWEVVDTSVLGKYDPNIDTAVYLLDWISMEMGFQPNWMDLKREDVIRMSCVKELLLGDHNDCLKKLNLSGACRVACSLGMNFTVKSLDMTGVKLKSRCAKEFRWVLEQNQTLKEVNLSRICLKDKGIVYVAAGLFKNRSLQTLHLTGNWFSGIGMEHLLCPLSRFSALQMQAIITLKCVTFGGGRTRIRRDGLAAIIQFLVTNETVRKLGIHDDESLRSYDFVKIFKSLEKNASLKCLSLQGCKGVQGETLLHTGVNPGIFANNIKIENILLDNSLNAKNTGYNIPLPSKVRTVFM